VRGHRWTAAPEARPTRLFVFRAQQTWSPATSAGQGARSRPGINTFLAGYTSKTGHVSRLREAFRTMSREGADPRAPFLPHHVICGAAHHAQLPCHALHYRHAKQREQSVHPWAQAHAERCTGFRWSSIRTQTCAHTATIMRACKPNVPLLATASTMRRDAALCAAICRK